MECKSGKKQKGTKWKEKERGNETQWEGNTKVKCQEIKKGENPTYWHKEHCKNKWSSLLQNARGCDNLWNLSTLKAMETLFVSCHAREMKRGGFHTPSYLGSFFCRIKRLNKHSISKPMNTDYTWYSERTLKRSIFIPVQFYSPTAYSQTKWTYKKQMIEISLDDNNGINTVKLRNNIYYLFQKFLYQALSPWRWVKKIVSNILQL